MLDTRIDVQKEINLHSEAASAGMPYLDEKSEHNAMPDEKSDTVSLTNSSRSAAISSVNHEVINGISQNIPYAMANVCIEDDELNADLEVEQVNMP